MVDLHKSLRHLATAIISNNHQWEVVVEEEEAAVAVVEEWAVAGVALIKVVILAAVVALWAEDNRSKLCKKIRFSYQAWILRLTKMKSHNILELLEL